jgi:hypothetical protein
VKDRRRSRSGITPYPMIRYRSRHRKRHDAHVLQQLEKATIPDNSAGLFTRPFRVSGSRILHRKRILGRSRIDRRLRAGLCGSVECPDPGTD